MAHRIFRALSLVLAALVTASSVVVAAEAAGSSWQRAIGPDAEPIWRFE